MTQDQIVNTLTGEFALNPKLVVFIRADKDGKVEPFMGLVDRCIRNKITNFSFRTAPEK